MEFKRLLRALVRGVLTEGEDGISLANFHDHYSKLLDLVRGNKNLESGLIFTSENKPDYGKDDFVTATIDSFLKDLNAFIVEKRPQFFQQVDHRGSYGYKWTGTNYDQVKGMSTKDITKLVREELKIRYPDWKFSVRSDHNSITVEIIDLPFDPYSEEYSALLRTDTENTWRPNQWDSMYNDAFNKERKAIDDILNRYNMDDSDSMTDYHHVNYYASLRMDDHAFKGKWYPQNKEYQRMEQFRADYKAKTDAANALAAERRGKYKRGTNLIYSFPGSPNLPAGDYPAVVLTSPNGQGSMSYYKIRFVANKRFDPVTRAVVDGKPMTYTTSTPETKLRPAS